MNFYNRSYSYISGYIDHNVIQLENSMYVYQNFGRRTWEARCIEYQNSNITGGESIRKHLVDVANYHHIPFTESGTELSAEQLAVVSASRKLYLIIFC